MANDRARRHDLIVVGAGSAGYAAARTARDVGCDVALVDKGPLGGLCILRGCMPSKALLASSDALADAREASALGVGMQALAIDMPFIGARKRDLVQGFAEYRIEGIEEFPLYRGEARFLSPTELVVGETTLEARQFVIATGSAISQPMLPGLAETGFLDSDAVLDLEVIPSSVVVLGGGYTACELGQFLARMGARTTMLIRSGHLLTASDDDVGDALTEYFREEGIDVVTHADALASRASRWEASRSLPSRGRRTRSCGRSNLLRARASTPNVAGLDLEKAGVKCSSDGAIVVDRRLQTSNPNIYAVGDVTGEYMLVHVAIYQGEVAARNACLGADELADYRLVSAHTVFTDPQFAAVGMSEKELSSKNVAYVSGRYDFAEHGKAQCLGKTKGFVKMMADPQSGRILGASVLGPQGSELIHEVIVAMSFDATVDQFMRIPHLHPTLAEIWTYPAEACAAQLGRKIPGDEQVELATSVTGD